MKYCFVTRGVSFFPESLEPFQRSGLWQWRHAFDGDTRFWADLQKRKEQLLDYDIIHINAIADDIGLATEIEPFLKGSKTKLAINMDISINYFDKHMHLRDFVSDLHAADLVFGVEPTQVNLMNYLMYITQRKKPGYAALIAHPVNTSMLMDKVFVEYDKRYNILACQYHKYDGHYEIPRMLMVSLPDDYIGAMMGYIGTINNADMADIIMPYNNWEKYIYFLARCKVGLEYRTHKAASRFVMEAGALGIPVVTTNDSHMGRLIFPEICHDVGDFVAIRSSIERLIKDEDYRLELARKGIDKLEPYNLKNSKAKMEALISAL